MSLGYQLKITIKGSKPSIWRRVVVPKQITFYDLDDIIEEIFGWTHSHLFEFYIKSMGVRFTGAPFQEEEDNAEECIDAWIREGAVFDYTYDFGDNWEHQIKVEKIVEYPHRYPTVIKSKGPNMIEDCGGIWGFYSCMDEADEFDMEAVNEKFRTWNLPVAEPSDESTAFEDDWKKEFLDDIEDFYDNEAEIRSYFGEIQTLNDVFSQYTKDNLVVIAKAHKLAGYSKYKKDRLTEWLVQNVLDEEHMLNLILHTDHEEIILFEEAIENNGVCMSTALVENSLFLATYGGFLSYYEFYRVPLEVQSIYKKLMTPEVKAQMENTQEFLELCDAAIYLYGVLSVSELRDIYNKYENTSISEAEFILKLQEIVEKHESVVLKDGYFMDGQLEELDLYVSVLERQKGIEKYLPEDKETFLDFGRNAGQQPDEDTSFFLEYLIKEADLEYPKALIIFYLVQEGIRMNVEDMELMEILGEIGCNISSQKKFAKAESMLRKFAARTRKWDYCGHTSMELNNRIVEFPLDRRVYPNDKCPCGSGRKFKHCCGKK